MDLAEAMAEIERLKQDLSAERRRSAALHDGRRYWKEQAEIHQQARHAAEAEAARIGLERDKWASLTIRERDKPKCHRFDSVANVRWCESLVYVFREPAILPSDEPMAQPQQVIDALRKKLCEVSP